MKTLTEWLLQRGLEGGERGSLHRLHLPAAAHSVIHLVRCVVGWVHHDAILQVGQDLISRLYIGKGVWLCEAVGVACFKDMLGVWLCKAVGVACFMGWGEAF